MKSDVLAADGRVIGARAQHTRRRLLETTSRLLDERGVMELKVVDVTREVGTSPATFYQYFADVDAAILALAEDAAEDERPLVDHLGVDWAGPDGSTRARTFVDAYMTFWDEHHAVLRIRNLKAEEGDRRFIVARRKANVFMVEAMSDMVREGQAAGRVSAVVDPFGAGSAMVAMVERLLAYQSSMHRGRGLTRERLADTITAIIYQTLTGRAL
jgi:AcrR family transcriptional regulator